MEADNLQIKKLSLDKAAKYIELKAGEMLLDLENGSPLDNYFSKKSCLVSRLTMLAELLIKIDKINQSAIRSEPRAKNHYEFTEADRKLAESIRNKRIEQGTVRVSKLPAHIRRAADDEVIGTEQCQR